MSSFTFVLIMDWVVWHANERKCDLNWNFISVLEDLDYADDVALVSCRFADQQQKTDRPAATTSIVGLKINLCKNKDA